LGENKEFSFFQFGVVWLPIGSTRFHGFGQSDVSRLIGIFPFKNYMVPFM
jgi:hypothetical protein